MKGIQSKSHQLGPFESCFDDKRYILSDGIKTLSCGHRVINYLFRLIQKAIRNIWFSQFSYFD